LVANGQYAFVANLDVVLVIASVVTTGDVAAADVGLVSLTLLLDVREQTRWRAWQTTAGRCGGSSDYAEECSEGNKGELHVEGGERVIDFKKAKWNS